MRMLLGLVQPTNGTVTEECGLFVEADRPMRTLGALLDAKALHGSRSAYHRLLCLAQTNDLPKHASARSWRQSA